MKEILKLVKAVVCVCCLGSFLSLVFMDIQVNSVLAQRITEFLIVSMASLIGLNIGELIVGYWEKEFIEPLKGEGKGEFLAGGKR